MNAAFFKMSQRWGAITSRNVHEKNVYLRKKSNSLEKVFSRSMKYVKAKKSVNQLKPMSKWEKELKVENNFWDTLYITLV